MFNIYKFSVSKAQVDSKKYYKLSLIVFPAQVDSGQPARPSVEFEQFEGRLPLEGARDEQEQLQIQAGSQEGTRQDDEKLIRVDEVRSLVI